MIKFFSSEELGIDAPTTRTVSLVGRTTTFAPIGIGKPLVIRLHSIYVGNLKTGIFSKKQDVLVTSVIKDDITYDAPARGVHQIFDKTKDRELLIPKASNEGTELIYYTKAFDQNRLLIDIEIKADKFNQEITDGVSDLLKSASGMPVFMAYAPYLLVGSQLIKAGGEISNKVLEKTKPVLSFTYNISQDVGGLRDTESGFKIGIDPKNFDHMKGYTIKEVPGMENIFHLEKDGKKYDGDIPYIIISLDGSSQLRYENFKATIASASILKRFYGQTDSAMIDDIKKIMEVYNDFNYINKIDKLNKELKRTTDPEKKKELEAFVNAYKENILNKDVFKAKN